MSSDHSLVPEILARLKRDLRGRLAGRRVERIVCPACEEPEAFAYQDAPFVIHCGRKNNCGEDTLVKKLWPDLFDTWSDRVRATPERPHAAAEAYLREARHLNTVKLHGHYTQETYRCSESGNVTATVRFPLPATNGFWERFIDRPERFGKQKARFVGDYSGHVWMPPGVTFDAIIEAKQVWITEGIFEAQSVWEDTQIPAVAAMSSSHYPSAFFEALLRRQVDVNPKGARPTIVWALNGDRAGRTGIQKHARTGREEGWSCRAAIPVDSESASAPDWNDLKIRNKLGNDDVKRYRHYGDLELAATAADKARLIYDWDPKGREFTFTFNNQTYFAQFSETKFEQLTAPPAEGGKGFSIDRATAEALSVKRIASCAFRPLFFLRDPEADTSQYYMELRFPGATRPERGLFSSSAVNKAAGLSQRFIELSPAAIWYGSDRQLILLRERWKHVDKVLPTPLTGYIREHRAYVFPDFAVFEGRVYKLNKQDYFELPKVAIKPTDGDRILRITQAPQDYDPSWLKDLRRGYGRKGMVFLAWWFGTLFAEQIRERQQSWPFFEWFGQAGSGKSTLLEHLWKLLGRDRYEGFDPNKGSIAYRRRQFAKPANLPAVMIESERENIDDQKVQQFDWDELKDAYNGRSVGGRAVTNNGMETLEPPFRGAICIAQNNQVVASTPILERIISVEWSKADHKPGSREAANAMIQRQLKDVSGFILEAVKRERVVLDRYFAAFERFEREFLRERDAGEGAVVRCTNERIVKNHAQLAACVAAMQAVLPIDDDEVEELATFIHRMAATRQVAIAADHPVVQDFWETVDHLNTGSTPVNHSKDGRLIALKLKQVEELAAARRIRLPPLGDLKKHLKSSRHPRYLRNDSVASDITNRTEHCWVFERTPLDRLTSC